ncbi:glycosyltransferase family 2 protein [Saccharothrix sp. 6-C]|uniref:Glycosyl transferase family 2 n=1 Tax=Saccharothrix texasensis TaxID=103734 RepID=A0A3N1GYP7_9PSEU|nr:MULTISPECIES: glycosyltransferase family 2 protein [Saccharothrix]QQQ79838.1 glycosyltransferase family 2 protein [Saccharothrix sp. 6-C]ROP35405.1 glycosyl transferase family 2 [Saccharothrix texasensis]
MNAIDIMLPHYGDISYLKTAVRSVIAQDDDNWRLTVIDDSVTDNDLPAWFDALRDDRVRYRRNHRNLGINANFQQCLDLAEHDFLVVMGSDDALLPNYVGTIRRTAQRYPDADVVQAGVEVIDRDGNVVKPLTDRVKRNLYAPDTSTPKVMAGEDLVVSLLRGNWTYFPSLCWRREALKDLGFRPGLSVVLDLALMLDLLERGGRLVVVPDLCFQYRRHDASVSSSLASLGGRFTEEHDFFLDVADHMQHIGWHRAAKAARLHLSSRLHALLMLPGAVTSRQTASAKLLVRHAFGTTKPVRK